MAEITGVVQDILVRDVAGGKKSYDIVVAGQKYGAGLFAPKCKAGDYVKFELDDSRGYKNVGRNTLKVSANKQQPEEVKQEAKPSPLKQASSFDTRQDTISRQAAMNTAIAFMELLSRNEALGLPASNTKGKRQEVLETMLQKYTQEFYEQNTGTKYKNISPNPKTANESAEEAEVAPDDEEWD